MIKIGDTILRNLEEQVLENKEQIALHWNVDRVLADFGIKVRGTLPTRAALDQIPTDQLQYGDAYFIGTAEPFDVWIWTRADVNAGKDEDYWLDIGHIAIEGPQGPQGPAGPQGERGDRGATWYVGASVSTSNLKDGDLWLNTSSPASTGSVYRWSASNMAWTSVTNIRGPQGIQGPIGPAGPAGPEGPTGPEGPRGEAGGFVTIKSILSSTDLLPNPAELNNPTVAFLVGTNSNYNLYVQVGESASTRTWHNAGLFNAATAVTVNGEYQTTWAADTKVDKVTTVTTSPQLYMKNPDGTNKTVDATTDAGSNTVPLYNSQGKLSCTTPTANSHTVNKAYADANFVKVPARGTKTGAIIRYSDGSTTGVNVAPAGQVSVSDIVRYSSTGTLASNNPVKATDVANKQYVDGLISKPVTKPVTIYLNLNSGGNADIAAGVLGISTQLTPAEITALKAGIASDAEDMTPRVTALFNYMSNNRYTMDYLALPVNGQIVTSDNSYYLSGGIHMDSLTTLNIRSGFGSEQQEPLYLQVDTTNISRVRLIVHIPNDPDDESP